jgi:hypothetical protein
MEMESMSLGERIVAMARIAAAEHVRQELEEATRELHEIDSAAPGNPFSQTEIPTERFVSMPSRAEVA